MSVLSFYLINCSSANSNYLNILYSLNYWDSNFLILFLIYALFFIYLNRFVYYWGVIFSLKLASLSHIYVPYYFKKKLVSALWVGTLNIHPPLFYITTILLAGATLFVKNIYTPFLEKTVIVSTLALALALGGLWGLQSLTWGYIWVNDDIEWVLLGCILYGLYFLHKVLQIKQTKFKAINFLFLLSLLVLIRLNVVTTRHSFLAQHPLSYFVLITYFIGLLGFLTNLKLKQPLSWNYRVLNIILVLFLIKRSYFAVLLKLLSLYFVTFFLFNFFLISKLLIILHFCIFLFIISWSSLYNYYFLYFKEFNNLLFYKNLSYKRILKLPQLTYAYFKDEITSLDQVTFKIQHSTQFFSQLSKNLNYFLIFTNSGVVLLIIFLVLIIGF